MIISAEIDAVDLQRVRALPGLMQEILQRAAMVIATKTINEVVIPHATGQLSRSLRPIPTRTGADVLADTIYARLVHDGRPAGMGLRLDEIRDWVRVKGLPTRSAYFIARSIDQHGTRAQPFLKRYVSTPAFESMARNAIRETFNRALS